MFLDFFLDVFLFAEVLVERVGTSAYSVLMAVGSICEIILVVGCFV